MKERIFITALGATTAVGRTAWASAAAVRAGVSGFTEHSSLTDDAGQALRVAMAPWLDEQLYGIARFEALLFPAIDEALNALPTSTPSTSRWAIALAQPSPRPGLPEDFSRQMLAHLSQRYGPVFGATAAFPAGHAAGLVALQAACVKLRTGALDGCVVAGAESWLEPQTLKWLESCDQLHGAGPLNNAWGFIPGEAGAALLLMRESVAHTHSLPLLAEVLGVGTAHEPKRNHTESVCIGEGLTQAFRAALAALPAGQRVSNIYCDMNGEPYRADEFGFTALRTKEHFDSVSDFNAPADCWGDVSAAGGLLHLILACAAAHKGYAKGPLTLAWASAEMGERAAALVATAAAGTAHSVGG